MIPVVGGSNPLGHPNFPRKWKQPRINCAGSAATACRALVDAALVQIAANVAGAIEGRDPEFLHQVRVGIRRLRTVLRICEARRLDKRLRKLALPLGEARDWDVFVERFGRGKARQREAHARCRRVLERLDFEVSLEVEDRPVKALAEKAVARFHRKALQRARNIDWRDEKRRHRVRIAVRRLRYACEFFSACFAGGGAYLRRLERLQELLGELNDMAVARRLGGIDQPEEALIRTLATAWRAFGKEKPPRAAR